MAVPPLLPTPSASVAPSVMSFKRPDFFRTLQWPKTSASSPPSKTGIPLALPPALLSYCGWWG